MNQALFAGLLAGIALTLVLTVIISLGGRLMSQAQALADATNKLAQAVQNAVNAASSQTPDAVVSDAAAKITAAADQLTNAFPPPEP